MRRFLTLVCLLCLAIPAGISISGCTRNPGENYCNGLGYGLKITDVASITLQPATTGISMAFGQTRQVSSPSALTCKGTSASASSYTYGTTNNQLVDISPTGNICAGTWNRNTGGGIANYTVCSPPNPLPSTGGLPYATAYISASAQSVTSNPVEVFVHAAVTSVSLVTQPMSGTTQQCFSQGQQATLDAQACYSANVGGTPTNVLLCAPSTVTSANSACNMPGVTPDIIASGTFTAAPSNGFIQSAQFVSGGSITGSTGQTCTLSGFNNGSSGATATVALTGANTIGSFTPLTITAGGSGATAAPTTATLSSGTATCSGTATVNSAIYLINGTAGQTCTLNGFNSGTGATATVALSDANTIASGTALTIAAGGVGATVPPTSATLSNGTATCTGTAAVTTTLTQVPNCTGSIGTLSYAVGTSSIASITTNTNTNQVTITAEQPGTTAITASVALSGSSAGYFSTCPPKSISLTLANDSTTGTINQGVTQNLVMNATDTNGKSLTGLSLTYQSTDPIDISAGSGGAITTSFPGVASVNAVCQPPGCNPAPIDVVGIYGTGLPISSNAVTITTLGTASDYVWFAAPGQSQYVVPIQLITGTVGSTIRLPYVPNSMVMDRMGNNLYFGSPHELMVYSTSAGALTTQSTAVPGVVLAVSPNNTQLLISDQALKRFYLYTISSGSYSTFNGMGNAAAWTPDSQTLYITDNAAMNNAAEGITGHTDTLYVYNQSNWTTYSLQPSPLLNPPLPPGLLPPSSGYTVPNTLPANVAYSSTMQTPALMIPSVGAFVRGDPTQAHTWCPTGTVGDYTSIIFYPNMTGDSVAVQNDVLAATTDGQHILGAAATGGGVTLNDIGVTIPTIESATGILTPISCPLTTSSGVQTLKGLSIAPVLNESFTFATSKVNATAVNQVIASPESNLAFVTYTADTTNTGAELPFYVPGSGIGYVPLTTQSGSTAPIAPLAGAFTSDDQLFFVSTAGDDMIHYISVPLVTSSPATADTQQISPNLPSCTPVSAGGTDAGCTYSGPNPGTAIVPATAIAVKPRATS